jgi:hypothetical protein
MYKMAGTNATITTMMRPSSPFAMIWGCSGEIINIFVGAKGGCSTGAGNVTEILGLITFRKVHEIFITRIINTD